MSHHWFSRRRFLHRGIGAAVCVASPWVVPGAVLGEAGRPGAGERIRVGVIGTGIRGKFLIGNLPSEAQVVAIGDCHVGRLAATLKPGPRTRFAPLLAPFADRDAESCATFQDYRKMLDAARLDAVMIATPDHHHVLAAMLACQAGLDVYVEKALSVTIAEGRALVRCARRHGRVVQVGSQNRSMEINRYGCRLIRDGGIGKVSLVEICNYPGPMRYEGLPEEPIPEGLDWEVYCGPTELRPYNWRLWQKDERRWEGRNWRGWDMWRAYSGHLMTNWGAHSVDMVQAALGTDETGPVEVWPLTTGHRGEMRTCPVAARYASGIELRFVLGVAQKWTFHGERGKAMMRRNELFTDPPELMTDAPDLAEGRRAWQGHHELARPHVENWLDCIRTRGVPNAPVEFGHRSVSICHLANLARELGRKLRWDPDKEVFAGDEEASGLLARERRRGFELPSEG